MAKEYKSYTSTFKVGDRVEDRKDHARGTVVAKYKHPELADVVVVKRDECRDGIAVPTEDLRRARVAGSSGVLTPLPPAEQATASKDEARQSCTDDGARYLADRALTDKGTSPPPLVMGLRNLGELEAVNFHSQAKVLEHGAPPEDFQAGARAVSQPSARFVPIEQAASRSPGFSGAHF